MPQVEGFLIYYLTHMEAKKDETDGVPFVVSCLRKKCVEENLKL